ncbi:putative F-box domain-containing protein [Seiridium unicorne]|uniref:F-box domain-containing protein n=1 Tax=Seiridium unicorne TaxID=138068 RepID=A0ABR2VIF2_9PEZI
MQPRDIPLHWYRYQLDQDLGNLYYLAGACAARHMPRLRTLGLSLGDTGLNVMMAYGVLEDSRRASLEFLGSPPFNPSHEVKEAWCDTTKVLVGGRNMVDIQLTHEQTDFS